MQSIAINGNYLIGILCNLFKKTVLKAKYHAHLLQFVKSL